MAKILLVEDDNSLREIYGTRLLAEGYDIVSAADGESALAMVVKEQPDLILSDIMMPRISGFEMIDILRSQEETKNVKVVVMTALSTDGQREKGESLGVDKYLVKSQVGIEDVVAAIHEVLGDGGEETAVMGGGDPNESVMTEGSGVADVANATDVVAGASEVADEAVGAAAVAPDVEVIAPEAVEQQSAGATEVAEVASSLSFDR
jgi:CheY-like chemotaxis protein